MSLRLLRTEITSSWPLSHAPSPDKDRCRVCGGQKVVRDRKILEVRHQRSLTYIVSLNGVVLMTSITTVVLVCSGIGLCVDLILLVWLYSRTTMSFAVLDLYESVTGFEKRFHFTQNETSSHNLHMHILLCSWYTSSGFEHTYMYGSSRRCQLK